MKDFLTITELAKILDISRVAVFKKIKSGQIKATKIGLMFVIPKQELESVLGESLTLEQKKIINQGIKKTLKEYGKTLELLGKE
jgi:excisionase family DNA binding protein